MKKIIVLIVCFVSFNFAQAQIEEGGTPASFNKNNFTINVPTVKTSHTDIQALRAEDEVIDKIKDIPWRYGYIHYVDVSFQDGVYDYLPNGDRIWRIKIQSANAQTLNLTFDQYKLEVGAKLFIYNHNKTLGAFNHKNNKEHGYLTTTLIVGEELTIELYEPKSTFGKNELHLERIVNGYRTLDYKNTYKGIGTSGTCNNNTICAVGDDWRDQIRSVGIISIQSNISAGFCSGALINNTCNDGKPYFLTANHCINSYNSNTIVVNFNFESLDCNTNNWSGDNYTISGTTYRAINPGSDVALLELSSQPPVNYNVFYAGWDHSTNIPTKQVAIHHPAGDLKKISFDNDPATMDIYSSAQCWRIGNWDNGTTEPGSSGSPLFNQDGNIIGQLYGGSAKCDDPNTSADENVNDFYGRFDISWDNGSGPTDQLQSWLDPCNTGVEVLNGYDPNAIVLNNDAMLSFNNKPNGNYCGEKIPQILTIRNRGVNDITSISFNYGIDGNLVNYNWIGNLSSNQSVQIELDSLDLLDGNYNYVAYFVSVNNIQDENQANDSINFSFAIEKGKQVEINITTNFNGNENYFTITNENDSILIEEGPFGQLESYNYKYCLTSGNYCVNMYDDGGNGLKPTFFNYDPGNYQLIVDYEEIINDDDIGSGHTYCFEVNPTTAINNRNQFNDFVLYPNPNNGTFTLKSEELINKIDVLNVLGAAVYQQEINAAIFQVQLNDLTKGIYFVKIYSNKGTGLQKIMLK